MSQYISRITIDIDSHVRTPRLRVLRAVSGLRQAGADDVEVAVSSSGEGFHIVGYFEQHVPTEQQLRIRENLNDDPNRIQMDRQRAERGLPINTMWGKKGSNEGERYVFETPEDALAHVEATSRSDYERAHGLANHGRKSVTDMEIPHTKGVTSP